MTLATPAISHDADRWEQNRTLLPVSAIVFFGFCAIGLPLPALPLQVHDVLGFDPVIVGWVIGLQSLVTVLTRQFAGSITDTRGAKMAVLFGLPLAACSGLCYLVSLYLGSPNASLAVLIVGRLLLGLAESLFLTGTMTWGILRLGLHRTGKVMSWQGIAMFLALTIGGPVGAVVMERFGFFSIAVMTVVLPLVGMAIALAIPASYGAPGTRVPFYKVIGLIWRHGLALSLATIPYASLISFITLYFHANNWANVGFALSGFGGGYILVRLFFAHLPDRLGGLKVAAVSLGIEAVGQVVLWLAPDPMIALLGATLTGIGFSLVFPSLGVEAVKRVAPQSRGMAVAGFIAFLDISLGLTGPLMGLVIALGGYSPVFLGGAAAALAALAIAVGMARVKAV